MVSWLPLNKATQFQNLTTFNMKNELSKTEQPCTIHGVGNSVSVPAVRVRFYPIDMDETFDGTVIDEKNGNYIVIPDDDLCRTERWHKSRCDVLR
jgi:hypothetical protein